MLYCLYIIDSHPLEIDMKHLQLFIAALIIWLIFLFNIERLTRSVDIRSYTYIFVALVAMITIMVPRLSGPAFSMILVIPVPIFLIIKSFYEVGGWQENLMVGNALPLTVTQLAAIILTGLLARQISHRLVEFNDVVATITFGRIGHPPPSFAEEQGVMYNELKRARHYHRPLTVMAMKVDPETINGVLPKMLEELQHTMLSEYLYARLARILDEKLLDFDTIVRRDDCFILLLPETTEEKSPGLVKRLEEAVKSQMGIQLKIGTAVYPDDAMTFERLIETAVQNVSKQTADLSELKQSQQPLPQEPSL